MLDLRTSVKGKVFLSSSRQDPVLEAAYVGFLHNHYEATPRFAPLQRKDPLKLSNLMRRPRQNDASVEIYSPSSYCSVCCWSY